MQAPSRSCTRSCKLPPRVSNLNVVVALRYVILFECKYKDLLYQTKKFRVRANFRIFVDQRIIICPQTQRIYSVYSTQCILYTLSGR